MRMMTVMGAATLALGLSTAAIAAPASVDVTVGPKLQDKAAKTYGVDEVNRLAGDLRQSVERTLTRTGAYDGQRIELTLVDAVPNRPTMKQMSDRIGLSLSSFGVGGAKIEGKAIAADGQVTPIAYGWYETDIRQAPYRATWSDAQMTFDRLARKLGGGNVVASR